MTTLLRCVPLVFAAFLGAGCGSTTRALLTDPLPLHVAILPVAVRATDAPPQAAETDLLLRIDPRRLADAIAAELDGRHFARATVLALPDGMDANALSELSDLDRDALWIAAADRAHADVVLECELVFAQVVETSINEKFWLNLPLFLLGGPFCYFVDDRSYRAEARLRGSVYELQAILAERASLQDGLARLGQAEVRFESVSFDFIDRAGGNAASYAASVFVPAGLLARDSKHVAELLDERVATDLARELASEFGRQQQELLAGERVATFHLDPAVTVERTGGRVSVHGAVVLRCLDTERLDEMRLRVAGAESVGQLDASVEAPELSTLRERLVRIPFRAAVADDGSSNLAQIVLVGGGPSPSARTFTLPLPAVGPPAERVIAAQW